MDPFDPELESPIGRLRLVIDPQGRVLRLWFPQANGDVAPARTLAVPGRALAGIADRLRRYFAGELDAIDDIAIAPQGSPLQSAVWSAVRQVPAGQVTSYGALASRLGHADRRMARSIGMANAANPVAILIPCHRVVGKDGSLRGYAWGLERKRWLLAHERARIGPARAVAAGDAAGFRA